MESRNPKAYTVSIVNQYIKNIFLSDYALNHIYVKGEVSNLKYHSSGHIYFTLKDAKSQIACVMFAGQRSGLSFRMMEGNNVIVLGNIGVYERDGKYQLYANQISLDGQGTLYEKFEQLKQKLLAEGIFDTAHKKQIPFYAKKVGIVTAETGAAIQDIINISTRRNPYVELILYPAKVQGEGAAETIVSGIKKLDTMGVDVIIVGRGGGSIEDLWAFNEEIVARAVYECKTPVISAVGHETDITIADYAADLRAPTPSAAAELAVLNISDLQYDMITKEERLNRIIMTKIQKERNVLEQYRLRLSHQSPVYKIQQNRQLTADMEERLGRAMQNVMQKKKYALQLYIEKMKGLSPLEKLNSGFSYVVDEDGVNVKSVEQVKKGTYLTVSVLDGDIHAIVEKTSHGRRI